MTFHRRAVAFVVHVKANDSPRHTYATSGDSLSITVCTVQIDALPNDLIETYILIPDCV